MISWPAKAKLATRDGRARLFLPLGFNAESVRCRNRRSKRKEKAAFRLTKLTREEDFEGHGISAQKPTLKNGFESSENGFILGRFRLVLWITFLMGRTNQR